MEEWQRRYLTANMRQLVELAICNETLLSSLSSDGILSHADLDFIRSTRQRLERTRRLYDILYTRVGGFGAMSRALAENKQSDAHAIFRKGYIECLPHFLNVSIFGKTKPLSNYLTEAEIIEIIEGHIHAFESKALETETVSLLKHAPPPEETLYIPRKLFKRSFVNTEIFQQISSDIFVFKGIHDLHKLVEIVRPQIASKSSSQLGNLTCRFIQLEDDVHWDDLSDNVTVPIHLIKFEEETKTCVLEQTKGVSNIIKQHITREHISKNPDMAISEDTFVHEVVSDSTSGVCICDLPGMGKTLLLAKISKKISELYPDRLVAFIPLSQFIKSVTSNGIPLNCGREEAHKFLLENLAASSLAQDILEKIFAKEEIRMDLLFDAFDEVPFQLISFTKKLLTEFATKLPNTRIYVTSRPHMRQELEDCLGVHSYDILPFSEENQVEFLVSFWKSQNRVNDDEKLEQFARYILEELKNSLSRSEQNMAGIPLQCRLLAQVYSRGAKLYAKHKMLIQDCCHFEGSLPELYKKYVEQCFSKKLSSLLEEVSWSEVQKYHIWMAIQNLFPESESQIFSEWTRNISDIVVHISISIGILERRVGGGGQSIEFVHRTFAEYFVSEFLAQMLNDSELTTSLSSESKEEVFKFLLEKAMITREISDDDGIKEHVFINSVVVYFLDFFVDFYRPLKSIKQLAQQFPSSVSPEHLNGVFFGCARENYTKLVKFIREILLCMEKLALEQYKKEMLPLGKPQHIVRLLNVASLFSSHFFVEEIFALALECFECDFSVVCKEIPLNLDTPLHFAVERADVEMVQFFARHISLEGRKILRGCVIGSNEYPSATVKKKAVICKILLHMNRNILTEANYTLYDSVHIELIKVLIEAGTDVRTTEYRENIVHRSAEYMSNDNFHELCRFLIVDHKAENLFLANKPKWKSPLPYIFQRQEKISIETCGLILEIDGVDINKRDDHLNNLFLSAVERNQDIEVLDFLAKAGADIHAINAEGQNALHLAAETKNTHVLTFLLNLGINSRLQDSSGNSLLHLLGSEGVTAEAYHEIINVLAAKGQTDIFHMRNEKGQLPIHWAVYNLELKKETLQLLKRKPYWIFRAAISFNAVDNKGWSVLVYAAVGGRSVQFLSTLIEMGADVMKRNKEKETFAHFISKYCSAEQYHELVLFLISKEFYKAFTTTDKTGITPLHWAAFHIELLPETLELIHRKLFQERKVYIKRNKCSILMYAAAGKRSLRVLKSFIEMGANVYIKDKLGNCFADYVRHLYSVQQYHEMVEFLWNRGQQDAVAANHANDFSIENLMSNQPGDSGNRDDELFKRKTTKISSSKSVYKSGYCVLLSAAEEKRSVSLLKSLIEKGADIHIKNGSNDTFAHRIAYYYSAEQYHEIVEFLIRRGQLKVFAVKNNNGQTPIHLAVFKLELLESTLDLINTSLFHPKIVDINSIDKWGDSILMSAAKEKRRVSLLKSLIEKGANVQFEKENGNNFVHHIALYYSAAEYHEIAEFLITRDQKRVFAKVNKNGETPIHIAISKLELLDSTLDLFDSTLFQTSIVDINSTDKWGNSLLLSAAKGKRSVSLLKKLIERGADSYIQNINGDNFAHRLPCHYSADEYHEVLDFLINRGEEMVLAIVNHEGKIPIHVAFFELELLESTLYLLNSTLFQTNFVDINSTDDWGNSFLMYASEGKRSVSLLKSLIENGADVHSRNENGNNLAHLICIHYSAEQYHELVKFLINSGHHKVFLAANNDGETPIHVAAYKREVLKSTMDLFDSTFFETNIVSINSTDKLRGSFLMYAARGKRSVSLLKSLIEKGAGIYLQNEVGDNFAHCIAEFYSAEQYQELVQFLIRRGERNVFTVKNNMGMKPIHAAINKFELHLETLIVLLACSVSQSHELPHTSHQHDPISNGLNEVDNHGRSVLHWALRGKRSLHFVKLLISHGADWSVKNKHNISLAHASASYGLIEHLKYFVELGCDVNALDNDGDNVLQCAVGDASKNVYEMVKFLLEKGAYKHHMNKKGHSAFAQAIEKGITDKRILDALK